MAGKRLECPHCHGAVAANPLGHWFQRFQCPHCKQRLQFDPLTNNLGKVAGVLFAASVLALVLGNAPWTPLFSAACGALWLLALAASYALRGVVKG